MKTTWSTHVPRVTLSIMILTQRMGQPVPWYPVEKMAAGRSSKRWSAEVSVMCLILLVQNQKNNISLLWTLWCIVSLFLGYKCGPLPPQSHAAIYISLYTESGADNYLLYNLSYPVLYGDKIKIVCDTGYEYDYTNTMYSSCLQTLEYHPEIKAEVCHRKLMENYGTM